MSAHGIFHVPEPHNEPVLGYEPGNPERDELRRRLDELSGERLEIPLVIGGEEVRTGSTGQVVMPHDHGHVLATYHQGGAAEVGRLPAIEVKLNGVTAKTKPSSGRYSSRFQTPGEEIGCSS